jgi:hypothetical protein
MVSLHRAAISAHDCGTTCGDVATAPALFLCDPSAIRSQSAATDAASSGDTARAIAHLERALTLDPFHLPAASTLMSLHQKEGNTAEADAPAAASAAPQSSPGESGKTAEQVYKNIEILKGVPAGHAIHHRVARCRM